MNLKKHYRTILIFIFLTVITFFISQKNTLGIAPKDFFKDFQHDSESLVLGKIVSEKYNKEIPLDANLGFSSIIEFNFDLRYRSNYIYQSYSLLKDKRIEDYLIKPEDINDENWSAGIARKFAGIVVKRENDLDDYIGSKIFIPNAGHRIVKAVEHSGNYTNLYLTGSVINSNSIDRSAVIKLSGEPIDHELIFILPRLSQHGIQGAIFSKIYNSFFPEIKLLYRITSWLFALTIVTLVFIYKKIISANFAIIFFLTIILSPWMISFARNLYWVPFTWFLPAIFAGYYFLSTTIRHRVFSAILIYFSFLFKCLTGYEYISSIILLAAAIFFYELFNSDRTLTKSQSIKGFFIICSIGVAGFLTALLMHAGMRGDSVLEGLKSIYEMDVKRRTYGDPETFGIESYAALSSTPWEVVKKYIFTWDTEFLRGIPGYAFYILLTLSVVTISYRYYAAHQNKTRDAGLFIAFFMSPLSWFILAKGHSGVHFHMNYVLWYFGFAACIVYVSLNGIKIAAINIVSWANKANPGKI